MSFWGGIASGLANATANIFGTNNANEQNRQMAERQMQFQQTMSETSHQREVEDLKKAGLNPILSANSGAPSPGGAAGTFTAPQIEMPDIFSYGISLKQLEQRDKELSIMDANSKADIAKKLSDKDLVEIEKMLRSKDLGGAKIKGDVTDKLHRLYRTLIDDVKKPSFKKHIENPDTNINMN